MQCPGQDSRFWKPGAIFEVKCPHCGRDVEFFKDDTRRKCPHCGNHFANPRMDFGCAAYCKFADQCLGDLPAELLAQREELLKDRVAVEMKRFFGNDFKRIAHAGKVARYAEKILYQEGGDPAVVLSAAYLHDIGLHGTKPGEGDGHAQKGSDIASDIMKGLGARQELADEVRDIVARHHDAGPEDGLNLRIVCDADRIVNLQERLKEGSLDREALAEAVESGFLTDAGREAAREALLEKSAG